jgi:hypothetical protein
MLPGRIEVLQDQLTIDLCSSLTRTNIVDTKTLQAKRITLAFTERASKDAEIPVGLSDQDTRRFHTWSTKGGNPHIRTINENLKNGPKKDPFKGLTKIDKEDLLAWTVHSIQNAATKPSEAPTTESAEDLLESDGDLFSSDKDLSKHLAKQLGRIPDSGLEGQLVIEDNGTVKFDSKKKN